MFPKQHTNLRNVIPLFEAAYQQPQSLAHWLMTFTFDIWPWHWNVRCIGMTGWQSNNAWCTEELTTLLLAKSFQNNHKSVTLAQSLCIQWKPDTIFRKCCSSFNTKNTCGFPLQRASNVENVSILWVKKFQVSVDACCYLVITYK